MNLINGKVALDRIQLFMEVGGKPGGREGVLGQPLKRGSVAGRGCMARWPLCLPPPTLLSDPSTQADEMSQAPAAPPAGLGQPAVEVVGGSFAWQRGGAPLLRGVSLAAPRGSLVVVVGAVGSGKSSLLAALLGEMVALEGRVAVRGSTAYTQQDPFIQVSFL